MRGQRSDIFRVRESSLELHLPWLDERWAAGDRNAAALWRQLKQNGFRGCMRVISEWATRQRQADKINSAPSRTPAARTIARLMTISRDQLSRSDAVTVAAIEDGVPLLLPGGRKSVEPMAARVQPGRVQAAHQPLHPFVAKSDRSDDTVLAAVRARRAETRRPPQSVTLPSRR